MRHASLLAPAALLLAVLLLPAAAQDGPAGVSPPPAAAAPAFPAAWEGVWRGPCRTGAPGGDATPLTMELRIAPVEGRDAWTFTVVYEAEGRPRQVRPYELVPVDRATGHWRIDEGNAIVLGAWIVDDTLHSRFSVSGSSIETRQRLRDGGIDVAITSYREAPAATTGGEGGVPRVRSYALASVQRGRLERIAGR